MSRKRSLIMGIMLVTLGGLSLAFIALVSVMGWVKVAQQAWLSPSSLSALGYTPLYQNETRPVDRFINATNQGNWTNFANPEDEPDPDIALQGRTRRGFGFFGFIRCLLCVIPLVIVGGLILYFYQRQKKK